MTAVQIAYDFGTNLSPSTLPAGWAASAFTDIGSGTVTRQSTDSGILRYDPDTSSTTQTTIYLTVNYGPTNPSEVWTPGTIVLRGRRSGSSAIGYRIRTSADGYASGSQFGRDLMTSSYADYTYDLSAIGPMTGPLTLRIYADQFSGSNYLYVTDFTINATVASAAQDVTVASGIASAEAFGGLQIFVPASADVFPDGIASAEAFGGLQIIRDAMVLVTGIASLEGFGSPQFVPDLEVDPTGIAGEEGFGSAQFIVYNNLLVVGIPTGQAFGLPEVGITTAEEIVDYPTGTEVATFLGSMLVVDQAEEALAIVRSMARAYTRTNGFYTEGLKEDLRDMIVAATARLMGNPDQIDITVGGTRRGTFFKGWTLAERKVLDSYRKVAY